IDSQGIIITEHEKNNLTFRFYHRFWMGSYTISFILLNTKHYQIMISDYVNNGQWINRNEFDKELSRKMREVLPSMSMKHDLLLSYNSLASHTCVYFDFSIKHKIIGRMVFRVKPRISF
ncbi:unnamed protein product, partial [Rotaria magnacalcarata]